MFLLGKGVPTLDSMFSILFRNMVPTRRPKASSSPSSSAFVVKRNRSWSAVYLCSVSIRFSGEAETLGGLPFRLLFHDVTIFFPIRLLAFSY